MYLRVDASKTRLKSHAPIASAERMRGVTLDFTPYSANGESVEALKALRREVWGRTEGGVWPVLIIPRDSRSDVVLGLLAPKVDVTQMLPGAQETSFTVEPLAAPDRRNWRDSFRFGAPALRLHGDEKTGVEGEWFHATPG